MGTRKSRFSWVPTIISEKSRLKFTMRGVKGSGPS